jgi:hypothetical protein
VLFVGLAALLSVQPAASQDAQQAGVSAAVRGTVQLSRLSGVVGQKVESGEPILLGDRIESGPNSGMQILLLDETVFTIGPDSDLTVDEFVYDPNTQAGTVTASVSKGVFRFITGRVARNQPSSMKVKLPVGTIGIRGTIVAGLIEPNGNVQAVLLGPGSENNTGDRVGSFTLGGLEVSRANYGVAFTPGTAPTLQQFTPEQVQGITGRMESSSGAAGSSQQTVDSPAGSTANADEANSLSGQTVAQATGVAFATQNIAAAGSVADAFSELASEGVGGPFSFEQLRSISTGQASFSGSFSGSGVSISSISMLVKFGDKTFDAQFSSVSGPSVSSGNIFITGNSVSFASLEGAAFFDNSLFSTSGDCVGNCTAEVVLTSGFGGTFNVNVGGTDASSSFELQ